jgi:23S rRNA (uracil1939-C5)-methyltransferase
MTVGESLFVSRIKRRDVDRVDELKPATVVVEAIDLTHDALGVCKLENGFMIFVEGLLKGERAEIVITETKKNYGFGKVINLIEKSPYRVTAKCKHYDLCGGCSLMHMDYDLQLSFKKYRVETTLKRIGLNNVLVNDMTGMINPYFYRNKVEVKFRQSDKGIEAGFFQARSHTLVNLDECHIMPKRLFDLLVLVKNVSNELFIKAYDETTKHGFFKSAILRESSKTKQVSILFMMPAGVKFPHEEVFIKKLIAKIPEIASIAMAVTDEDNQFINEEVKILFGEDGIIDAIDGMDFWISHRSFFQTNPVQTERLYKKALDFADLTGKEKIIDAYCGIGTISLVAAKKAYKVFGIDNVKPAVMDARKNAELNHLKNVFFEVGEAEVVIQKWKKFKFDVIFVDPPRKGCEKAMLDAIIMMKIPKIVYVSCDPGTLARDLKILSDGGYSILEVTPFDMFPQSVHVETVTLLQLK